MKGDPGRLRQVQTNLVGNTVKFTAEGEIAVTAAAASSDDQGIMLRLEVRDSGIGIPADKLNAVFESFTQVDASIGSRSTIRENPHSLRSKLRKHGIDAGSFRR